MTIQELLNDPNLDKETRKLLETKTKPRTINKNVRNIKLTTITKCIGCGYGGSLSGGGKGYCRSCYGKRKRKEEF